MVESGRSKHTQVHHPNSPPGLHVDVQGSDWQELLGNALVDPPQQLLGFAFVHDGDVLIAADAYLLHYICSLHSTRALLDLLDCNAHAAQLFGLIRWPYMLQVNLL